MKIPWSRIITHYQELARCEPTFNALYELSRYVAASQFADELYAWTAATDLCIARRSAEATGYDTYLRISHCTDGNLEVRHVDALAGGIRWQRTIDQNQLSAGFRLCVEQMRWSTGEAAHAA